MHHQEKSARRKHIKTENVDKCVELTTTPFTTSPPRKQSAIFTLSFSVARTSCERITPVKSSPCGRGTPSTTVIDMKACRGDKRVMVPRMIELGIGGCGRVLTMRRVYFEHYRKPRHLENAEVNRTGPSRSGVPTTLARTRPSRVYSPSLT